MGLDARPQDPLTTWEWDHATPAEQWKRSHNEQHHTYTNILGKDNDLGYGILRVDEDQPWKPRHLCQPAVELVNACIFEYGIAMYDLELGDTLREKRGITPEFKARAQGGPCARSGKQAAKDYVVHPALSGPVVPSTLAANLTANLIRNVWSHSVIMCGHFPEGVETFEQDELDADETRGEWYLRQMLGSANISGSQVHPPDDRQPVAPDRAPPLPGPAVQPVRRDRAAGARPVRALRAALHTRPRCRSRSPAPGTRSSGSRCRTAGSRRPTSATWCRS